MKALLSILRVVYLRRLKSRPTQAALQILSVAAATALAAFTFGSYLSLTRSTGQIQGLSRFADLEIAAHTQGGFDESLAFAVSDLDDVSTVVPLVLGDAYVERTRALVVGLDASAEQAAALLGLDFGSQLEGFRERPGLLLKGVFLGEVLATQIEARRGDEVTIYSGGKERGYEVIGVIRGEFAQSLNQGLFVVALREVAQDVIGHPARIDSAFVKLTAPEAEAEIRDLVGTRAVLTEPGLRIRQARQELRPFLLTFLALSTLVGVVAAAQIANAAAGLARSRLGEIVLLRAAGAGNFTVLAGGLAESAVFGLIGSAVGVATGLLFAGRLLQEQQNVFLDLLGIYPTFEVGAGAALLVIFAGTGLSLLASIPPALRSSRQSVTEALAAIDNDRPAPLPSVAGLAKLAGAVARLFGTSGRLAEAGLIRTPRRVTSTVVAVALSTGIIISVWGLAANLSNASDGGIAPFANMQVVVQSSNPAEGRPVLPVPGETIQRLAEIPGVGGVSRNQLTYLNFGEERIYAVGVERGSHHPLVGLVGESVREEVFSGGAVVVSRIFAKHQGVQAGDTLLMPQTNKRLPIAEVIDLAIGSTRGAVGLSYDLLQETTGAEGGGRVELILNEGADEGAVLDAANRVVTQAPLPLFVTTGADQVAGARRLFRGVVSVFASTGIVAAVAMALVVLAAISSSLFERRRELEVLRAVGASRRFLNRATLLEGFSMAAVGTTIGVGLGWLFHLWLATVAAGNLGFTLRGAPNAGAFLAGVAISILTSTFAARVTRGLVPPTQARALKLYRTDV